MAFVEYLYQLKAQLINPFSYCAISNTSTDKDLDNCNTLKPPPNNEIVIKAMGEKQGQMSINNKNISSLMAEKPVIEKTSLKSVLNANREWAREIQASNPDFFPNLANGQSPKILWIGCSDSRVPPTGITTGLGPGDVFVHRNVGNCFLQDDPNGNSVLEYATQVLNVYHIVVCGHSCCGAVAASQKVETGLYHVDCWIAPIKQLYQEHKDSMPNNTSKLQILSELNALSNASKIAKSDSVQSAWKKGQALTIHAWCYQIDKGEIKDLCLDLSADNDLEERFNVAVSAVLDSYSL